MKGCYGITIHYLRVLCVLVAPFLFMAAGMAFNNPLKIGNYVVETSPTYILTVALFVWVIVAARVMRKR